MILLLALSLQLSFGFCSVESKRENMADGYYLAWQQMLYQASRDAGPAWAQFNRAVRSNIIKAGGSDPAAPATVPYGLDATYQGIQVGTSGTNQFSFSSIFDSTNFLTDLAKDMVIELAVPGGYRRRTIFVFISCNGEAENPAPWGTWDLSLINGSGIALGKIPIISQNGDGPIPDSLYPHFAVNEYRLPFFDYNGDTRIKWNYLNAEVAVMGHSLCCDIQKIRLDNGRTNIATQATTTAFLASFTGD